MAHPSDAPGAEGLSPERRARILAGAAAIFDAEGYEGASMSQIANSANVSKGTLYNYFPSKQALFTAFVQQRCSYFVDEVFGDLQDDVPVAWELKRVGRLMLKMMLAPTSQAVFRVVVMEAVKFPDLAKAFLSLGPDVMIKRLTTWLTAQNLAGRLRTSDPQFAAEQYFALTQTRLVMRRRCDPEYQITEVEIEQVLDGAVSIFLSAYSTAK